MHPAPHARQGQRLGIDLGGTKTEAALLSYEADGSIGVRQRERTPTLQAEGYDTVLRGTAELIRRAARWSAVPFEDLPIGVGMPGNVRRSDGAVKNSNTTCLNGRPFRQDLQQAVGRELLFDNDANCFALAETWMGAARGRRDGVVFGVILGTGVGGGLVIAGKPWSGLQGIAGEWGHHQVFAVPASLPDPGLRPCYCGRRGCLETYASGTAVQADYAAQTGTRLALREIVGRRETDPAAAASIDRMLEAFGLGLANVINVVDPSLIVLGGGVSNVDALYTEGVERVRAHVFNDELLTPIVRNELGDSAGVLGAALLGLTE
jgi:fructokinase